jgi:hypothetical protein
VERTIDHAVHDGVRIVPAERKELVERRDDAELLGELARRAGCERLTRRQHPADAGVPVRRIDILGRGTQMHEELSEAIEHQDVGAAVRKPVRPHLAARDGAERPALLIDDVHQLVAGVVRPAQRSASSKRPPSAASSSGVFTLRRLRAAPPSARSSRSST